MSSIDTRTDGLRPGRYAVVRAGLLPYALSDQWFGSRADPTSPAASMTAVPAFAALAVVIGTVLALYLRHVDRPRRGGDDASTRHP